MAVATANPVWLDGETQLLFGSLVRFAPQEPTVRGWELIQPLTVTIERDDDDSYIVTEDSFLVYGVGDSLGTALRDYVVSLVEYHDLIVARGSRNPLDQAQRDHLNTYLRQSSAP